MNLLPSWADASHAVRPLTNSVCWAVKLAELRNLLKLRWIRLHRSTLVRGELVPYMLIVEIFFAFLVCQEKRLRWKTSWKRGHLVTNLPFVLQTYRLFVCNTNCCGHGLESVGNSSFQGLHLDFSLGFVVYLNGLWHILADMPLLKLLVLLIVK